MSVNLEFSTTVHSSVFLEQEHIVLILSHLKAVCTIFILYWFKCIFVRPQSYLAVRQSINNLYCYYHCM